MDEERLPVADDEFVLRRIHRNYYQADLPMPVTVAAFRPNENDTTGLSVFRDRCVQPADVLANLDADKKKNYYVARIPVSALRQLGLTILPEPDANGPAGHAVIPELSHAAYHADKKRSREIQLGLAKLASQNI